MRCASPLCSLLLVLATASTALSQDRQRARELFERGMSHANREEWVPALEAFRSSLAQAELPATLFNIAAVLVRVGRHREAIATLDRILDIAETDEDRANAVALRQDARRALRTLVLDVEPDAASVLIDGVEAPERGPRRHIVLDPGSHRLTVRADGHAEHNETIATDQTSASVSLSTLPATLVVRSSLAESRVSVDGSDRGLGEAVLELDPGPHRVEVYAAGHEAFVRDVELQPGERLEVAANLSDRRGVRRGVVIGVALGIVAVAVAGVLIWSSRREDTPNGGTANFTFRP